MSDPSPDLPSSWANEDRPRRSIPRWVWIVVGLVVCVVVAITAVNLLFNSEEKREWPAEVSGRPSGLGEEHQSAADVTPDAAPGVYVWSGFDGWHLWVVDGADVGGVTGTITSDEGITEAVLSAPGAGSVAVDDDTISFQLPGDVALAGVDFSPEFFTKQLTIELTDAAGEPLPVEVVHLGSDGTAEAVPVGIDKPIVD